jgi:accessory gene regulator B
MLGKLAQHLSVAFSRRGIFETVDAPVYSYGFELLLSTGLDVAGVIVISVLYGKPLAWLYFLLPVIPLRSTAGGYHAKTHLGCFFVFVIAFTALLNLALYVPVIASPFVTTAISAACFLVVWALSPIPSENKPVSDVRRNVNRRKSLLLSGVCVVLSAASVLAGSPYQFLFSVFALGQLGAAVSLIAAWLIGLKARRNTPS